MRFGFSCDDFFGSRDLARTPARQEIRVLVLDAEMASAVVTNCNAERNA